MDPKLTQTISQILTPFETVTDPVKNTNAAFVIFDLFLYHIEAINIEDPSIERFIDAMLAKAIEGQQKSIRKHAFGEYVNEFSNLLDRIRKARELESKLEHEPTTTVDNPRHGSSHCRRKLPFGRVAETEKHVQEKEATDESVKLKLKLAIDKLQKNMPTDGFWQRIRKQVDTEELGSSKISRLQRELQRML